MSRLNFKLEATASNSRARAGTFRTLHNEVKTPLFMPVGTMATVRGQNLVSVEQAGSQILLANTYHLLLRPGPEVFRRAGGIHPFANWGKSVLTDSGGFQIFSLPNTRQMTEDGAIFKSYVDGELIHLSPETSIQMQMAINSDIMMVLDQCVPSTSDHATSEAAMHLTHRWAKRSLATRGESPQSMFAIVQGACHEDLRKISAEVLTQMPFDGFAIGGLAVGETKAMREDFTELTAQLLPRDLPRYLMGVGTPIDLLEAVHRGVDMFDCILPTALAQQGVSYTSRGRVDLRRGVYTFANEPLDPACACQTCTHYTRAYLHHLIRSHEFFGWQLVGAHNLHFYHQLMSEMRAAILNDTFAEYYRKMQPILQQSDPDNPKVQPQRNQKRIKVVPMELGAYEVHEGPKGFASIRQKSSGEIMHSVSNPDEEARRLYADQSRLATLVSEGDLEKPLVLWDVGLGASHNLMSAIRCYEELAAANPERPLRPLEITSFENDLDSLKLALLHPRKFPHIRHAAPAVLAKTGEWRHKTLPVSCKLLEGDFLKRLHEAPPADLIFFDPFSFKTDSDLWTVSTFKRIHDHCRGKMTRLFTYSASTAVRAALLAAGFFVGKGLGTGPKSETTVAFLADGAPTFSLELLGSDWLTRWERSGAKFPYGIAADEQPEFERVIRGHRQFLV